MLQFIHMLPRHMAETDLIDNIDNMMKQNPNFLNLSGILTASQKCVSDV